MGAIPDVLIVGGGVVGAACARQLALSGRRVCLAERGGNAGEAWRAAAGLLAAQIEDPERPQLFELGISGREFYRAQAPGLLETTGVDIGFRDAGILQIARGERDVRLLKERVARQRQRGHHCDWLESAEVKSARPWLGPTDGAFWAPHDGALDPVRLVEALRADALRLGVEVVTDEIISLTRADGRITGAAGRDRHPAGVTIVAAGAWSGRLAGLPRPLSVEPVRGQMLALPWPDGVPPAIVYGAGGYVLARGDEAIAGSTMEHAGFVPETTGEGMTGIRDRLGALVPALSRAAILRAWAGLRPGTPDGLPILGREPLVEGLWYATGHGRNGMLLAGISAVVLTQLLSGEAAFEEVDTLRPERFWSW